jgi:AcrR family transcriptional regulator
VADASVHKRQQLLRAVLDFVDEHGAHALRIQDISARTGIARATVYRYFESKDHLLAEALAEWHYPMATRVLNRAGGAPLEGDAHHRLAKYVDDAMTGYQRHPNYVSLLLTIMSSDDAAAAACYGRIAELNASALGALIPDVPEAARNLVVSTIQYAQFSSFFMVARGGKQAEQAREITKNIIEVVLEGAIAQARRRRRQAA